MDSIPQQTTTKTVTTEDRKVTHINWGAVAKGAAIVAGVVLVGVVGAWALGWAASALLGIHTVSGLVGTAALAGHTTLHTTGTVLSLGAQQAGGIVTHFSAGAGIPVTQMAALPAHMAQGIVSFFQWAGGLIAGGFALHTVAPMVPGVMHDITTQSNVHSTTTQVGMGSEHSLDAGTAAAVTSTKVMKVGYHAAEDTNDYRSERGHAALLMKRAAMNQSWADYVGQRQQAAAAAAPAQGDFRDRVQAEAALPVNPEAAR